MSMTAEQIFKILKHKYNPRNALDLNLLFDMFFGGTPKKQKHNFLGGCGDRRRTLHEQLFSLMCPDLKQQVVFGTGKDGYKKFGTKRYIADFYDEQNKIIYEIDGSSHKSEVEKMKDAIRDWFFFHEKGIKTIRVSNERVEEILLNHLKSIEITGEMERILSMPD